MTSTSNPHSVMVIKYCSIVLKVLSLVHCGAKRRTDSTNNHHSAIVTKYCSIVLKLLSLVLFGSKVRYYSTEVLCHYNKELLENIRRIVVGFLYYSSFQIENVRLGKSVP